MPLRIPFFQVIGRFIVVYDYRPSLSYNFTPYSGILKLVKILWVFYFAVVQYPAGPGIEYKLLLFLVIEVNIPVLALCNFKRLMQNIIQLFLPWSERFVQHIGKYFVPVRLLLAFFFILYLFCNIGNIRGQAGFPVFKLIRKLCKFVYRTLPFQLIGQKHASFQRHCIGFSYFVRQLLRE